jgi:transposase
VGGGRESRCVADDARDLEGLRARIAELEALTVSQAEVIEALRSRIAELEAERSRHSGTSSKPPSTDPVGPRQSRAERRARQRAARKQGKQPGAPGANLARRHPDETVVHPAVCCAGCGADLADAAVTGEVRRQVIDLPPIQVRVTDHIAERRRCACGHETVGVFPPEAKAPVCWGPEIRAFAVYLVDRQHLPVARVAELLEELLDAPVSTGWLCALQLEAAGRLAGFVTHLKTGLAAAPVVHADETGTRIGVKRHWVHTLTTNLLTLLVVHPKRGIEALEDIGVLPDYDGTVVHDGWAPYERYDQATHAQCGAHLLRYLASVGQTPAFAIWTAQMAGVLIDAKLAAEAAADAGKPKVHARRANVIRRRYHDTLDVAFALLPDGPPPPRKHRGGWNTAQRDAYNLAIRMRTKADQVLRLLDDTRVPFTNNNAERSIRMVKLHDKISGNFRSTDGAQAFVTIRSYIQTAGLHDHNRLDALRQLFTTGAWLPPLAGGT